MEDTFRCTWCRNRTGREVARIRNGTWICSRCDDHVIPVAGEQPAE